MKSGRSQNKHYKQAKKERQILVMIYAACVLFYITIPTYLLRNDKCLASASTFSIRLVHFYGFDFALAVEDIHIEDMIRLGYLASSTGTSVKRASSLWKEKKIFFIFQKDQAHQEYLQVDRLRYRHHEE
mmetsp:Transcript_6042/g.8547  ORF Transcript_6042/g.8547 Transcript_6042/m.8547 type:complete len:129 (-) Transcript_6042:448-834(-)